MGKRLLIRCQRCRAARLRYEMSDSSLAGRVAIVTGGARGMGAAQVELLAAAGAHVMIGDVREQEGRELAERLGTQVHYRHLDVTSELEWAAVVEELEEQLGPVG